MCEDIKLFIYLKVCCNEKSLFNCLISISGSKLYCINANDLLLHIHQTAPNWKNKSVYISKAQNIFRFPEVKWKPCQQYSATLNADAYGFQYMI